MREWRMLKIKVLLKVATYEAREWPSDNVLNMAMVLFDMTERNRPERKAFGFSVSSHFV